MSATLLEQFLSEECTPYVRDLIKEALNATAPPRKRFEFNRFEVTIDREAGTVSIDDVLDATSAGELQLPLAEFAAALDRHSVTA
jgi:hypothetical protein